MPRFLVALLLLSLPAAAQSPIPMVLLPEQPVAEPATRPIDGGVPSAIATDGTNFLIVSTGVIRSHPLGQFAMLVDPHGQPLLKTSIRVGDRFAADVAWSGHHYLVVAAGYSGEMTGTIIDASGKVLNPAPIQIRLPVMWGSAATAVQWDGGQFVILSLSQSGWFATRISEAGEVLQSDIDLGLSLLASPHLAAHDGISLVMWTDAAGTHLKAMNAAGVVGETIELPGIRGVSLLAADDGFVMLISSPEGLELQHLSAAGRPDRPRVKRPMSAQGGLRFVERGPDYLLLFRSAPGIPYQAVHINASGDLLDAPREVPAPEAEVGLVASTPTAALSAFATTSGWPGYQVSTNWARPLLKAGPAFQVHRGYVGQQFPRLTWQDDHAMVSWTELRPRVHVVGASDGRDLAGDGSTAAAIASGPVSTLHVFGGGRSPSRDFTHETLYAVVVGEPVLLDDETIDTRFVRAVWTGSDFLVVWTRGVTWNDSEVIDIVGARVSASGALIDGPHVIANTTALRDIALGASATQALMVYQSGGSARGVRLDAFGAWPTDDITTFADQHHRADSLSVASDGRNFFVSWINHAYAGIDDWIAGRLIDAEGRAITPLSGYSTGRDHKQSMAAFWTGQNYVLIWTGGVERRDLWAARVAADGKLLDYPPVQVGPIDGFVTSIARGPRGQVAVAYVRDSRVYTRLIAFGRRRGAGH